MNIRIDGKKLFNNILFLFGILFLAQASKLLELGDDQDQFDDITDSLDIIDNDHNQFDDITDSLDIIDNNQNQFDDITDSLDIIDNDHSLDAFMNIEDSIDIIDDDFVEAFMDVEKAVDIRDNDVKDAECRNRFLKIIDSIDIEDENEEFDAIISSIHVEDENEIFDNDVKNAKKQSLRFLKRHIRKLCFSFLCRTDVCVVYLALGKNFQEEFWTLFQNEWDRLRREKALKTYEKNLRSGEIVGPILGGFMFSTARTRVTIQNLLKEHPNIRSLVRRFPLSARCELVNEFYHFNSYNKKNSELSFTDNFGVGLILNLGNVSLRTLVNDEKMPDAVVARFYNPDRNISPRVKEVRFVFVSIAKIKKMIEELNTD